jgi:hypothetical protein
MPTGAEAVRYEGYRCSTCGAEYSPEAQGYLCPRDGGCLEVVLDLQRARGAGGRRRARGARRGSQGSTGALSFSCAQHE